MTKVRQSAKVGAMPPDLMTAQEVAAALNVSIRTVHRMATDGRLPAAMKLTGDRGALLFERDVVERAKAEA